MVTLTYNGVEKSLADWGFNIDASLTLTNQANDVFAATIPTATLLDTPIFPFEAQVVVRSYDANNAATIEFTGKRLRELVAVSGGSAGVTYRFAGPWYDLDHTVYQQKTAGYNNATKQIEYTYQSEAILYTRLDANNVLVNCTNGQQIADILQFVIDTCAAQNVPAPFQIGSIDPAVNLPSQICKPQMCSSAIEMCLQLSPDCTFYFDYRTSPPTANARARSNATPLSLPLFDGTTHKSVRIEPRPDMVAQAIIINYKRQNTADGQSFIVYEKDKYPPNGPDAGLRVIIETVDLAGFQYTTVQGSLEVEPVAAIGGTNDSKRKWWASVRGGEQHLLTDYRCRFQDSHNPPNATNIPDALITDDAGNTTNPATGNPWLVDYPNRVVDGAVHPWMTMTQPNQPAVQVIAQRLTVKMSAVVAQYDTSSAGPNPETDATTGKLIQRSRDKDFVCHITCTNGITADYNASATFVGGEDTPIGVAQSVYNSLAQLQYEGNYLRVQNIVGNAPTMGNVLNLSGGRPDWSGMNAQIQSIKKTYGMGYTEVSVGPARHLNAGELARIFNAMRFRRVWYNKAVRQDAASGGGNVALAKNLPKGNTTPAGENPIDTTHSTGGTPADATVEIHSSVVATVVAGKTGVDPTHPPQNVKMIELATCDPETGSSYKRCIPAGGAYT